MKTLSFATSGLCAVAASLLVGLLMTGCGTPDIAGQKQADLRKWFVAAEDSSNKKAVPFDTVAYFDKVPTRKHRVIGYVCPPAGRFRSWGELLNTTRAAASLYGADAVYIDQQKEMEGWGFSLNQWGGGGGKWKTVQVRATAVVWED